MPSASKLATISTLPPRSYYEGNDLLTAEDVAAWLKVKKSWIKEQTRERTKTRRKNPLPHTKMGKYSRFSRMRIAEWLAENSS